VTRTTDEALKRRDKDIFDAGFSAGIGWALKTDNEPLIMAAEELLNVVTAIDRMWSCDYHGPENSLAKKRFSDDTLTVWRQMRAAIAKAEASNEQR